MATTKKTLKVHVNGFSSGKNNTSLSVKFDRDNFKVEQAVDLLVGGTLEVKMIPEQDVEGQKPLFDEKYEVSFTATCTGISVSLSSISTSIKIGDDDANLNKLKQLKFKTCKAIIQRKGTIATPDDASTNDEPAEDPDDPPEDH